MPTSLPRLTSRQHADHKACKQRSSLMYSYTSWSMSPVCSTLSVHTMADTWQRMYYTAGKQRTSLTTSYRLNPMSCLLLLWCRSSGNGKCCCSHQAWMPLWRHADCPVKTSELQMTGLLRHPREQYRFRTRDGIPNTNMANVAVFHVESCMGCHDINLCEPSAENDMTSRIDFRIPGNCLRRTRIPHVTSAERNI